MTKYAVAKAQEGDEVDLVFVEASSDLDALWKAIDHYELREWIDEKVDNSEGEYDQERMDFHELREFVFYHFEIDLLPKRVPA